jgi:hypothetical protein
MSDQISAMSGAARTTLNANGTCGDSVRAEAAHLAQRRIHLEW